MRFGVSRYQPSVKSSAQAELSPREEAIPVQGQNETNSTSDIGYLTFRSYIGGECNSACWGGDCNRTERCID